MLGGGEVSWVRFINSIAQDPRRLLEIKADVIPLGGEVPHGELHVMHEDWRIWFPWIMRLEVAVNYRQVRDDQVVQYFNAHEHFLRVFAGALAEYAIEIPGCRTNFHLCTHFHLNLQGNTRFQA